VNVTLGLRLKPKPKAVNTCLYVLAFTQQQPPNLQLQQQEAIAQQQQQEPTQKYL
jgi:hypothetical protein